jgi:hypothetical protein
LTFNLLMILEATLQLGGHYENTRKKKPSISPRKINESSPKKLFNSKISSCSILESIMVGLKLFDDPYQNYYLSPYLVI